MIITHKKNTANPNSYRVYSAQMKFSESKMDECLRMLNTYYTKKNIDGVIESQLGTDIDIHEGVDAIVTTTDGIKHLWQIRNREEYEYSGELACKLYKRDGTKDELHYTTATHYLTVFWFRDTPTHISIVNMQALKQRVLSNLPYYTDKAISSNSKFYAMKPKEYVDIAYLIWDNTDVIAKLEREYRLKLYNTYRENKDGK